MTTTEAGPGTPGPDRDVETNRLDVSGRARVDDRVRRLAARLEPGDIAVIDQSDLDRVCAQALVDARPAAVLNVQPSSTGRRPVLGPGLLLAAGIPLVDDLGPDLTDVHEGQVVSVRGGTVSRGATQVASGRVLTEALNDAEVEAAREGAVAQVQAFVASTGEYLDLEADLLMGERALPEMGVDITGRPVVLVLPGEDAAAELRALRRWMRDTDPVLVGVDAGADVLLGQRLRPDLIVGDMDTVSEKALTCRATLVLRAGHDGQAPGRERLDRRGLRHGEMTVAGTSEDAAVLLADLAGASVIVRVGAHTSVEDFLDRGRAGMASTFFTSLRAGDRLVSAPAVLATYRPRIGAGWLVLLVLVALVAVGVALWSTPWGHDLWNALGAWIAGTIGGASPSDAANG